MPSNLPAITLAGATKLNELKYTSLAGVEGAPHPLLYSYLSFTRTRVQPLLASLWPFSLSLSLSLSFTLASVQPAKLYEWHKFNTVHAKGGAIRPTLFKAVSLGPAYFNLKSLFSYLSLSTSPHSNVKLNNLSRELARTDLATNRPLWLMLSRSRRKRSFVLNSSCWVMKFDWGRVNDWKQQTEKVENDD